MKQLARNIYNNIRGGINGLKSTLIERFIPSLPSKTIRNLFIRWSGVKASKNVHFYFGFTVRNPKGLIIEDGVNIGPKCLLDARKGLIIRKNAVLHMRLLSGRLITIITINIFVVKEHLPKLENMLGFVVVQ